MSRPSTATLAQALINTVRDEPRANLPAPVITALERLETSERADTEEEAKRKADDDAEQLGRIIRRGQREALRNEHRAPLVKRFNAAAKHLKHNASRLHRVAHRFVPSGCSLVGTSWSHTMHVLADACLGLNWRNETTVRGHPPDEKIVERILAAIAAQEGTG